MAVHSGRIDGVNRQQNDWATRKVTVRNKASSRTYRVLVSLTILMQNTRVIVLCNSFSVNSPKCKKF